MTEDDTERLGWPGERKLAPNEPFGPWEPITEVQESGIASIEIAISDVFNRKYTPRRGYAKWFMDAFGDRWCKFYTDAGCHVIPAPRVREVIYQRKDHMP